LTWDSNDKKKSSSEELDQILLSRREVRRTLPLRNSQKKKESSNPTIEKNKVRF
jgi:hypothetical protein